MRYLKTIGFGALVWVIVFVVVSAFVGFGLEAENTAVSLVTLAAVLIAVTLLAKSLKLSSPKEALTTGITWLVVGLVLDAIITVQFTGWEIFSRWNLVVGYLIILLVPLLTAKAGKSKRT